MRDNLCALIHTNRVEGVLAEVNTDRREAFLRKRASHVMSS